MARGGKGRGHDARNVAQTSGESGDDRITKLEALEALSKPGTRISLLGTFSYVIVESVPGTDPEHVEELLADLYATYDRWLARSWERHDEAVDYFAEERRQGMKATKKQTPKVTIRVPVRQLPLVRWVERATKEQTDLLLKALKARRDNTRRRHLSKLRSVTTKRHFVALADAVQSAFVDLGVLARAV